MAPRSSWDLVPETSVSVVIATGPEREGLTECLQALAPQREEGTEVFVVTDREYPADVLARFPWVTWAKADASDLVPQRWARGFDLARNDVVALTTAQFTPAASWLAVVRESHRRLDCPAIGGPIDPPETGGAVGWATYFLRYSGYLACRDEGQVADLAGDNASYKREAVAGLNGALRDGFWEQELHRQLRGSGQTLRWVPAMRVRQRGDVAFLAFMRQRFRHGLRFGRTRMAERGWPMRLPAIVLSPLIPLIFSAKISGRVLRNGEHLVPFVRCLPVLLAFLLAWSAGEACGYLSPSASRAE
jgi:hypothetical protein